MVTEIGALESPSTDAIHQTRDKAHSQTSRTKILAYVHMRNIHESTGAGRTARQIVEHLAVRNDVDMRVLADTNDQERILPLVKAPWTNYRYHTFATDTSRQQANWFLFNRPQAEHYWSDAEIVFCTGESYVPVKRARLVVTAHDAGYFERGAHIRDTSYWKQRLKWSLLFAKLGRHVDMFHTVSQFSADRLAHFFPQIRSRIQCIHNGVTPRFFGPVEMEGRNFVEQAGLANQPYVLVPGGLHFRKNADLILTTSRVLLKRFPDLKIVIVNHNNPVYLKTAQSLGERLKPLGFVSDSALHALYAMAKIVWFPSRYEGFGLPVLESMASGTPVVASNSSSIPEIAGNAAVLVAPTDPNAHLDAISSLLTDSLACQQFVEAGRVRAAQFTWAATAAQLKRNFDTLL